MTDFQTAMFWVGLLTTATLAGWAVAAVLYGLWCAYDDARRARADQALAWRVSQRRRMEEADR